ncbi:iclR helix-turn-helix domain-containing protein [Ditylenchus destructor]|nr:iclR helix-turn-helix domain-containing protein [Ditylenchus destructor]
MKKSETSEDAGGQGVLQRAFAVLRVLADAKGEKLRLTDIAARTGQAQATVHRVLQGLVQEGMVEQPAQSKGYQLTVAFFSLAAAAGNHQSTLRSIYRPAMLRLCGMLNDTVFLLVRSGFDAVCLDRIDGAFPVRSHTGDIGGRVPLGLGQGGLVLLANLPPAEREEVLRFNIPRLHHLGFVDEISMRVGIKECLELQYARSKGQGRRTPPPDRRNPAPRSRRHQRPTQPLRPRATPPQPVPGHGQPRMRASEATPRKRAANRARTQHTA